MKVVTRSKTFENENEASILFINLIFQKLRAYLCLLAYYFCLTGFVCSRDLFLYSVMPSLTVAVYHVIP